MNTVRWIWKKTLWKRKSKMLLRWLVWAAEKMMEPVPKKRRHKEGHHWAGKFSFRMLWSKTFVMWFLPPWGFPHSSVGKNSTCNAGDPGLIPESGRSSREGIGYTVQYSWTSLVVQLVKKPPAMQETWIQFPVGKIPWRRERLPPPVFWPGEFHGLNSPWGLKELDMNEQLSFLSHWLTWFPCSCEARLPAPW